MLCNQRAASKAAYMAQLAPWPSHLRRLVAAPHLAHPAAVHAPGGHPEDRAVVEGAQGHIDGVLGCCNAHSQCQRDDHELGPLDAQAA
eukprot:1572684-Pyramimonas_sp.AAC.1